MVICLLQCPVMDKTAGRMANATEVYQLRITFHVAQNV